MDVAAPAVEGWFTLDPEEPRLLGLRCTSCGTVAFPPTVTTCPSPDCAGDALVEHPLSRRGTVWSYATNHYAPPPPYVPPDPFVPYTVVAVELAAEQLTVLGQLVEGEVAVGDEVELVLGTLADGATVWMWRPTS